MTKAQRPRALRNNRSFAFERLEDRRLLAGASDDQLLNASAPAEVTAVSLDQPEPLRLTPLEPLATPHNTGEKPQSKVWTHAGKWWSVMPNDTGTWVWRLDGTAWSPVLKLSSTVYRGDAKTVGDVTHLLLYRNTTSRLASIEYVADGAGSYQFWSARPTLPLLGLSTGVETATLDMDSTGRLWVASDAVTTAEVRYSDFPYSTWSAPITVQSGITDDDIVAITALPSGQIGLLWSDQAARRFGFKTHIDGADPAVWSSDEAPASQSGLNIGGGMADDHLNVAVASDGTLYAAIKTSYDQTDQTAIGLLIRRPSGLWDPLYNVDFIGTRPIVLISEQQDRLLVAYREKDTASPIVYRDSRLSTIFFGDKQILTEGNYTNPSSTKQTFANEVVIIAANGTNLGGVLLGVAAPVNRSPVVFAGSDQTITLPDGASLNATITDDGLPNPPGSVSVSWSAVSGPGQVVFADPSAAATTCTFDAAGEYTLRVSVSDGELITADDIHINVLPAASIQTLSFQDGVGPTMSYAGTRDSMIRTEAQTKNFGSVTTLKMDGSPDEASLIRWDLSSIPAGSIVHTARIVLNVTNTGKTYELYKLKRDWVENQVTWRISATGIAWAVAGAQGDADRDPTILGLLSARALGLTPIELNASGIAAVQSWVNDPASNFGFILQNYTTASDGLNFDSHEAVNPSLRPRIEITFLPPSSSQPTSQLVATQSTSTLTVSTLQAVARAIVLTSQDSSTGVKKQTQTVAAKRASETQLTKTAKKSSVQALIEPAVLRRQVVRSAVAPAAVDAALASLESHWRLTGKK